MLANRMFVVIAVGMAAFLTLYNQLYLSLPLEIRRLTGDDAGPGILFTICALLSIMTQVHITAYLKVQCRPLQAIAVGLTLMGGAFLPLLAAGPFFPIHTPPDAFGDTITLHAVVMGVINFSPAFVSAMLLSLGTMVVSPFALSLIPILGSPYDILGSQGHESPHIEPVSLRRPDGGQELSQCCRTHVTSL